MIERMGSDPQFKADVSSGDDSALSEYDLTEDERTAIRDGDEDRLRALGASVNRRGMSATAWAEE